MLRYLDLYSGIGAFPTALKRLGIEFETVNFCEIDKYAIKSYCAIHGTSPSKNLGDISKVNPNKLKDYDLISYGFPCTDISVAGLQKGFVDEKGNLTRSGLLYPALDIIRTKRPKYAIAENVKNLVSKKFRKDFDSLLSELTFYGYKNYWCILNAEDFDIPQHRERVFIVSIRDDIKQEFEFPKGTGCIRKLKDVLEDEVDEKYYINQEKTEKLISQLKTNSNQSVITVGQISNDGSQAGKVYSEDGSFPTICACTHGYAIGNVAQQVAIPCLTPDRLEKRQNGRRFKEDGEPMFTLTGQDRHGVMVREATKQGYDIAYDGDSINLEQPNSKTRRGRVQKQKAGTLMTTCNQAVVMQIGNISPTETRDNPNQGRVYDTEGISPTLGCMEGGGRQPHVMCINTKDENGKQPQQHDRIYDTEGTMTALLAGQNGRFNIIEPTYRIRKLTPLECWRLMDFSDEDFKKAKDAGVSDSQLYKQAGNSICVGVLVEIFRNLLINPKTK